MARGQLTASSSIFSILFGATSSLLSVAATQGKLFTVSERARISATLAAVIARTPDFAKPRDLDVVMWVVSRMVEHSQTV